MILNCRSCSGNNLKSVASFGFTPLANALLTEEQLKEPEGKFPLDLMFCADCCLVQIVETVPPKDLFSQYFYVSSISKTTLKNAEEIASKMIQDKGLDERSEVLEIGSNDGYLLSNYVNKKISVLGVEPAENIGEIARENGVKTVTGFFGTEFAKGLRSYGYRADVIHANNVLAHVADLHGILEGIRLVLALDGVCVIETHYVRDMIESAQFDCVYHEHLCYYSATALAALFSQYGMKLVDVERTEMHGGTLRAFFQKHDGPKSFEKKERVEAFLKMESSWVDQENYYRQLAWKAMDMRNELLSVMANIKGMGKSIAVYGASAKSTTLLNYFGIDQDLVDYVVDATPIKQGKYTPGTHLKIYPPESIKDKSPDYLLLLTWNFAKEIIEKEKEYRAAGGHFIIPIPRVQVV